MANKKVSELSELSEAPANNDIFIINDVSDDTGSSAGTTKKITYQNLISGISSGGGSSGGGGFQSNQITKDNLAGDYILPDVIYVPMIRSGVSTLRPFYFNGFFGTTDDPFAYIQYEWIIGNSERFAINFLNDTDGSHATSNTHDSTTTTFNFSIIPSATTNQPSIKEFIADDRAVYFAGGGSSGTNVVFESNINSMIGTLGAFVNVPHVPTIDTYSAWDSSNHVWVAPKNMTALVNCNHSHLNDHKHLIGQIRIGTVIKAIQGSIKDSVDAANSNINLSAVIEVEAGDEISSLVSVQGDGSSVNLNAQIMTITELGGGGNSILPSGSILQKVVSAFPDNTSLSAVGTEIASLDITPKASDSQLLCEITFLWQEQGTNGSQQQGKFYIDDVEFGGRWYNHISSTVNRLQTSLRSIATISDTNTKTISHKLTLDDLEPSRIESIVMSIEEIAQSTYTL